MNKTRTQAELEELAKMWMKPTPEAMANLIKKHGKKIEEILEKADKIAKE